MTAAPVWATIDYTVSTLSAGPSAAKPNSVAAGLFNNDARPDLVIANKSTNSVSIRMGDGLGGFAAPVTVSVGSSPLSVAVGDCDNDGDVDIFVGNNASDNVTVLRNNGSGVFTQATGSPIAAGNGPFFVLASDNLGQKLDLNGDGLLDLAVADRNSDKVTTLQGIGSCQFTALQTDVFAGNAPESIAAGNFDGANRVDLAVADRLANLVTVLRSTNTGLFPTTCDNLPGSTCRQFAAGEDPSSVVAGDFNADGNLDLAVTGATNTADVNSNGVSVLLGQGTGAFGTGIQIGSHGKDPEAVVTGNFTSPDTVLDLVVINKAVDSLASLQGVGNGTFTFVNSYGIGNAPEALVAGQFNVDTDANLDVVSVNSLSNDISTCLGQGNGTFTCTSASPPPSGFGTDPRCVAIADVGTSGSTTPDGKPDLIVGYEGTDDVGIYLNDGSGTAYSPLLTPPADLTPQAKNPRAIASGDWNGNGTTDFAVAACGYSGLASDKLVVVFDRNFVGRQNLAASDCPTAVKAKDLDGDGAVDLAVVNFNSNNVSIFRNNAGNFALMGTFAVGTGPTDLAFGDFGSSTGSAKDGKVDIAVVNSKSDTISILFGTGSPGTISFAAAQNLGTLANGDARGIAVADFNKDNIDDIAIVNHNTSGIGLANAVAIRLGFGGISFDAPVYFASGKAPTAVIADEVSSDTAGNVDLVVTNEGTSDVSVLEGRGNASLFDAARNFKTGTSPRSLATGDVNNDVDKDIVVANFGSDDVTILINVSPTCGNGVVEGAEQCDPPGTIFPTCPPTVCGPTCRIP
jgi:hypothetical protein